METLHAKHAGNLGMSRSALYRAIRAGEFDRIARGIYRPADAPPADFDWIEAATRRPEATICLTSALAHCNLTDAIPAALDIAIPRGTRAPATTSAIAWHHFAAETFELGRTETTIPGSELTIGIYSPTRCIADAFRLRYEIGRDALREWLRQGGKPAELMAIASKLPRAKGPILHALELLS
jgi:predicted transcriptional regulator of viral defense system